MGKLYEISKITCTPSELQRFVINGEKETDLLTGGVVLVSGKNRLAIDYRLFRHLRIEDKDPNTTIKLRYRCGREDYIDPQQLEKLAEIKAHSKMKSDIPTRYIELKGADKCTGVFPALFVPQYPNGSKLLDMRPKEQLQHLYNAFEEALILAAKNVSYHRIFIKYPDVRPICGITGINDRTIFDYLFGDGIKIDASDEEIQSMLDDFGRLFNYLCKKYKLIDSNGEPLQLYDGISHIDETTFKQLSNEYKKLTKKL